jgi:hypothetical protein
MDRDFGNSIILGYGPTEETHCQACKGNTRKPLAKGFAFYCVDQTSELDFVAGPECRTKIGHDNRTLSAIPHFGATRPIPEQTGRIGKESLTAAFAGACDEEKLVADMSAWVQLRQERLPALGFKSISFDGLTKFHISIVNNTFDIEEARAAEKIHDSIVNRQPRWKLENLQKCHDVAIQIARIETNPATSGSNRDFLSGIKSWLVSKYFLTPDQIQGLNNVAKYRGEPAWTTGMKFE